MRASFGFRRTASECLPRHVAHTPEEDRRRLYCVIDLSGGPNAKKYPVSYLKEPPKGGWKDEYKTTKLVLRRVKAGKDPLGRYILKKDFYIGVFEMTLKQVDLITGRVLGERRGNDKFPVAGVSYNQIRGIKLGSQWPRSNEVDSDSILGLLRAHTGLCFDLPTEMEWEYSCRAGTKTLLYDGNDLKGSDQDVNLDKLCRYNNDKGKFIEVVGSYIPNGLGLYDMYGNVNEWCRDWHGKIFWAEPVLSGKERTFRGGAYCDAAKFCTSAIRQSRTSDVSRSTFGFRVVIELDGK